MILNLDYYTNALKCQALRMVYYLMTFVVLTSVLCENFRYYTSYRWKLKKFVKSHYSLAK